MFRWIIRSIKPVAGSRSNSGAHTESAATEELFVRNFADYDYIVAPSGSCVHHTALPALTAPRTWSIHLQPCLQAGVPEDGLMDVSASANQE